VSTTTTRYFKSTLLQIAGWVAAALLITLIRYTGLRTDVLAEGGTHRQVSLGYILLTSAIAGALVGLAYGVMDIFLDRPSFRQKPYGSLILIQTAFHLGLLLVVVSLIFAWDVLKVEGRWSTSTWLQGITSGSTVMTLVYATIVSFIFNFLKQINRKFGPGNLVKLLLGKYYHPREEGRVFMFLDLKSSTTHAERLGHIRYSRLIQDCFSDLAVVIKHQAEVYQYVGDEAVLCWATNRGLQDLNCLKAYFVFDERLQARKHHYETQYGFVPEFKAGVNLGEVTVAEVGEIKREIAFHGDVLNTAARIQARCNEFGQRLLISGYLKDALPEQLPFTVEKMGNVQLRGRNQSVDVFAVEQT